MINDRERARAVAESAESFIRELGIALESARASDPPAEVEKLKRAVGVVIGNLEMELLWPLYTKHPDLEPESLKGWNEDK